MTDHYSVDNFQFDSDLLEAENIICQTCEDLNLPLLDFFALSIRKSIDQVLDGPNTQRYLFDQLEDRPEKTFIGTKAEDIIREGLQYQRGRDHGCVTDLWIGDYAHGVPADVKTSASAFSWMFPVESVANEQICLVIHYNDEISDRTSLPQHTFSVGLIKVNDAILNSRAGNRDKKRTLKSEYRHCIKWLLRDAHLPRNFISFCLEQNNEDFLTFYNEENLLRERMKAFVHFVRVGHYAENGIAFNRDVFETCFIPFEVAIRELESLQKETGFQILSGSFSDERRQARVFNQALTTGDYLIA
jgi:hypothetical protein